VSGLRVRALLVVVVASALALGTLLASARDASDRSTERFVEAARAATSPYQSRQRAIDDGFIRVGVEFPAMGEHWVSFARVLEDTFDAARPSVLIYANVGGEPRLSGVAYTKLLTGRARPPRFPSRAAWHEHSGSVDEESLPLGHTTGHGAPHAVVEDGAPRLFILHAWVWAANPEGIFVTDNWSLPATRLGVEGSTLTGDAIRAIALADDEDGYHRLMLRTALDLAVPEDSAAAHVIATHRALVREELRPVRAGGALEAASARRLEAVWDSLWSQLATALPARVADLRALRPRM
jgi:hypothetical protein